MAVFIINSEVIRRQQEADIRAKFPRSPQEPVQFQSDLGTPVYSFVEFPEGQYQTLDGETIRFDGIRLTTVLVDIGQVKNVVTTPIQGRNGTIKEYTSDGDWTITLTGRIVNQINAFPDVEMYKIKELVKVPDTIEVVCPFLNKMDISTVMITEATFTEIEGSRNQVDFEIYCLSDTPLILQQFVQ